MRNGQMRSVEASRFAMVPRPDVPRSAFDVTHFHKTTFGSGVLVPIYVDEVLPGDSHRVNLSAFVRLAPAVVPVMDNLILETFFFFCPNRILWEHWENMMGQKDTPSETTDYLVPYVDVTPAAAAAPSVFDYMGIMPQALAALRVVSLPFRAYNLIWNEWFRDQDLDTPAPFSTGDGPDAAGDFLMRRRRKRHDYFTSARPWPNKPSNATAWSGLDPLGPGGNFVWRSGAAQGAAPVVGLGYEVAASPAAGPLDIKYPGARTQVGETNIFSSTGLRVKGSTSGAAAWPDVKVLVSDIRTATLIQQMLEKDARGGTRYAESIRAHFGVVSPDARLQRPEYLGGGRSFVNIHPLAQTSASGLTGGSSLLGEQAGIGTAAVQGHGFSQSFTEHGWIIGLANVRGDLTYQQGVERMWKRRGRFEFYWPSLNGLSEQAIKSFEIYADGSADDDQTFGYQERWSEYKYKPSRVSGYFRSIVATPLDMWHFGQEFAARPVLNSGFLQEDPPVDRVLQVAGWHGQQFLADMLFERRTVRPMPMYSLPGVGSRL